MRGVTTRLLDVLAPCHCLSCAAFEPGSMPFGLCSRCRGRLEPVESGARTACRACGRRLDGMRSDTEAVCLPCRHRRSPLDRLYALWNYQPPFEDVIRALKFGNLPYLGAHLGRELGTRLPAGLEVDAIAPIPLHWRRAWSRGYNQAGEIASALGRSHGWPLEFLLKRRRPTPPQSGLGRASRRRNLARAFTLRLAVSRAGLGGARILLVDDVYTTGATAEAAARQLKSAGADWVGMAVAGRTPRSRLAAHGAGPKSITD